MQKIYKVFSNLSALTNAITREYELKEQIASGGPGYAWKIYAAKKKSTGQAASVFVFDKSSFFDGSKHLTKQDQEQICAVLRAEAERLARLRHPCLLHVLEPVDETRGSIAFATEPLQASLGNVLGGHLNLPTPLPDSLLQYELDELEVQRGLLQLTKALHFCHQDARLVHGNLCPESIYINAKGDFKLSGLAFYVSLNKTQPAEAPNKNDTAPNPFSTVTPARDPNLLPDGIVPFPPYDFGRTPYARASMDYLAPECLLDHQVQAASDIFAMACLIYALFNRDASPLLRTRDRLQNYRANIDRMSAFSFDQCPMELRELLRRMARRNPLERPSLVEIQQSSYFENLLLSTINYLENLFEQTQANKNQFFKGLPNVLDKFPKRALINKVLPLLIDEMKATALIPQIFPCLMHIMNKLEQGEFVVRLMPSIKSVGLIKEPVEIPMVVLEYLELILQKCSKDMIKEDLSPILLGYLDVQHTVVCQKSLKAIAHVCANMDFTSVKTALFPRLQSLYVSGTNLAIKANVLICFHAMLGVLDKFTIVDKMLPLLREAPPKHPAIYMAMLALYDELGRSHLDIEQTATEVIPELWKLGVDTVLSVDQFKKMMQTIHQLSSKVEQAHLKHLEEVKRLDSLNSNRQPNSSLLTSKSGEMTSFEQLVGVTHKNVNVATASSTNPFQPTPPLPPPVAPMTLPTIPMRSDASPSVDVMMKSSLNKTPQQVKTGTSMDSISWSSLKPIPAPSTVLNMASPQPLKPSQPLSSKPHQWDVDWSDLDPLAKQ